MTKIGERLDNLRELIQTEDFLEGRGLSKEVNFRMFCYEPKDEMAVRHFVSKLETDQELSCNLIVYNLYEIFLSICDDKRITASIPKQEEKKGSEFLLTQLHGIASESAFLSRMDYGEQRAGDVVMITGVGEVFPFMRMHTLMEAMQSRFSNVPVVIMYPGKYNGTDMKLFDKLTPNPYYRAFNEVCNAAGGTK